MKTSLSAIIALCLLLISFEVVLSAVIYESATIGTTGITHENILAGHIPASNVTGFNFVGARFQTFQRAHVSKIGGHFVGGFTNDSFFGTIVELTGESDFPDSDDLSTVDVLGVSRLTFPQSSDEVFGKLAVDLSPGWYAVLFGSSLFETTGRGSAVRNGEDIGTPSYINWQSSNGWFNLAELGFSGLGNRRFVVEGHFVPETRTLAQAVIFLVVISNLRRRRVGEAESIEGRSNVSKRSLGAEKVPGTDTTLGSRRG